MLGAERQGTLSSNASGLRPRELEILPAKEYNTNFHDNQSDTSESMDEQSDGFQVESSPAKLLTGDDHRVLDPNFGSPSEQNAMTKQAAKKGDEAKLEKRLKEVERFQVYMSIGSLYEEYFPLLEYYKLLSSNPKQEFTHKELVDYFVHGKRKLAQKAKGKPSQDGKTSGAKADHARAKKPG